MTVKFVGGPGLLSRRDLLKAGIWAGAAALAAPAFAQANPDLLRVALQTEPSTLDPHWLNVLANNALFQHMFDRLGHVDANQIPHPALAESWQALDDLTWEIKLRQGVTFHDGAPFTADDVIFTFERSGNVPGSNMAFRTYLRDKELIKVDDHTLHIRTSVPNPILPNEISIIPIISAGVGATTTTDDYNAGRGVIGTGPFKFVSWDRGARLILERNDSYWGAKPDWARVEIRPISSGPSRVAALLAGDVDLIDSVDPSVLTDLAANPGFAVAEKVSNRVIYLAFDQWREASPFVTAKDGSPLPNVLRDARVRRAISLALNRGAIAERILQNAGTPAGQLVPEGIFGHSTASPPPEQNADEAKKLLAEAGVPDGFKLTIHGPNDAYINDASVLQAVAQALTRIGIETAVEVMPSSAYLKMIRAGGPQDGSSFSAFLYVAAGGTGEASSVLRLLIHSVDADAGYGFSNIGQYANDEVDALIEKAGTVIDDAERLALLAQATDIAMAEGAVVPLYFPKGLWGSRKGISYDARSDGRTLAMSATRD